MSVAEQAEKKPVSDHILEDDYNNTPYPAHSFSFTHPAHLHSIGKLFGLKPKPIEKCRVLELGCAGGGNLLPMAYHFPTAEFLGIDLAEKQLEYGQKQIRDLTLSNIELRHQSILNFDPKEGEFDYIICHGVYSWVDDTIRDKIMSICKNNLSKNGIAYISYNTFPGWNMINSFKDLMKWHTKDLTGPAEKAQQARAVLNFISNGLQDDKSPYAELLRQELTLLSRQTDSYLLHEHLSAFNDPVYFYQFMEKASQHKLSYLADASLATMLTDNLPPALASELKKISNIVVANQYMDFIRNQRFRCTLLCHEDQTVNRSLKTTDIEQFYLQFTGNIDRNELKESDIGQGEMRFFNHLITLRVTAPLSQMAMYILVQNHHKPIQFHDLCQKLQAKFPSKSLAEIKNHLNEDINLMRCALGGLISLSTYPGQYSVEATDPTYVCPFVRYQAQYQPYATNWRHQTIGLDPLMKVLLPYMDGKHTQEQLVAILLEQVNAGQLTVVDEDGRPVHDKQEIARRVPLLCENAINNMRFQAMVLKAPSH